MMQGYLCLTLHAHLPFVRHPEEEYFLEENWLFEAITETYVPLIKVFDQLIKDDVDFRMTMSLTPPLISMLRDPFLQERYLTHLNRLIELAEKEIERTSTEPHYHKLALMYYEQFMETRRIFETQYQRDIVLAFKKFQDMGYLEIVASAATHGFMPILNVNPSSVCAQIQLGIDYYEKIFGCSPKGIWLPECAYYEGLDVVLKEFGIRYFFMDSHGITNADPRPCYGVYAPIYSPSGVAAFGRDQESSKQVWSAQEGYPGDVDYREYYRDLGHELEFEYIKPYIHPDGIRVNTGMKYWRITGATDDKDAYRLDWAREKASQHAGDFMVKRQKQIEQLAANMDRKPIVVAPYDAELFGHWWFEGPMWIDFLIRKVFYDQDTISFITPSEYLREYPVNQMAMPAASSWGYKGYNEFWLDDSNSWVYPHLHTAAQRMVELVEKFSKRKSGLGIVTKQFEHVFTDPLSSDDSETVKLFRDDSLIKRALNQAARELLLAEASDWPFIMKSGTMVPYAHRRIKEHIGRFTRLYEDLLNDTIDAQWLKEVESRDNIFEKMDCSLYYKQNIKKARSKDKEVCCHNL